MPIDPAVAVGAELPGRDLSWDSTDVLLYHLAVGAGPEELAYVYEDALRGVLPTFATVATTLRDTDPPKVSMPGIDVDLARVVHGRQELELHRPIPVTGRCRARSRIAAVYDKGTAAVVVTETVTELFTSRISIFAKGEGGFGGDRGPSTRVPVPERAPDAEVLSPTDPRQALWYRLCGDRNPLHAHPAEGDAPPRRPLRARGRVHRRGPGHRRRPRIGRLSGFSVPGSRAGGSPRVS